MKASEKLKKAIVAFEGMKLKAYKCPAGVWTIGVGHTKGVRAGQSISSAEAMQFLEEDLKEHESGINRLRLELTQGQFDALVDFSFNLGFGNLKSSTLLKKIILKRSDEEIGQEFMKWVYAGGKKLDGLLTRRAWEVARWKARE